MKTLVLSISLLLVGCSALGHQLGRLANRLGEDGSFHKNGFVVDAPWTEVNGEKALGVTRFKMIGEDGGTYIIECATKAVEECRELQRGNPVEVSGNRAQVGSQLAVIRATRVQRRKK